MINPINVIFAAVLVKFVFPKSTATATRRQASGIRNIKVMYPESVIRNFSRYRALRIKRKYLASSASCSDRGVHISPGIRESVAEAAAAPPDRVITEEILSSVCSMVCLCVSGSAAQGAASVKDPTASSTSRAAIIIFLKSKVIIITSCEKAFMMETAHCSCH